MKIWELKYYSPWFIKEPWVMVHWGSIYWPKRSMCSRRACCCRCPRLQSGTLRHQSTWPCKQVPLLSLLPMDTSDARKHISTLSTWARSPRAPARRSSYIRLLTHSLSNLLCVVLCHRSILGLLLNVNGEQDRHNDANRREANCTEHKSTSCRNSHYLLCFYINKLLL